MSDSPPDPRFATVTPNLSPAVREQVIAELTDRFAHDHLTMDEFERRAAAAYAATTPAALMALTADLPRPAVPAAATVVSVPTRIRAVLGNLVRSGRIEIPDRLEVRAILANVELDLTQATFAPGVTEIELHAFMGNIEIQLPPHVGMEDHVSTILGSFEYRRQPRSESWTQNSRNTSVVRFTGRVTMSSAEVTVRAGAEPRRDGDEE